MANALPRAALALGLLITPFALCAQEGDKPKPQAEIRATHGAWNLVCSTTSERCAMEQAGKDADGNDVLIVNIRKITPRDTPDGSLDTVISVLVPLGVLLEPGLGIQIDGGKTISGRFVQCERSGCLMEAPMPPQMVAAMKKGVTAKFIMAIPPNRRVEAPVSLSGFTAAFNSIQK
jgi:invasion protein IalB